MWIYSGKAWDEIIDYLKMNPDFQLIDERGMIQPIINPFWPVPTYPVFPYIPNPVPIEPWISQPYYENSPINCGDSNGTGGQLDNMNHCTVSHCGEVVVLGVGS